MKSIIVLYILGYLSRCSADHDEGLPQDNNCTGLDIVTREQWQARPPFRTFPLVLPVSHIIIHHTVFGACKNLQACIRNIQFIQDYHMDDKGYWGISYSFLIGGDGRVYEGKGWNVAGEHTINYNTISIGLAFLGNFNNVTPPNSMLDAARSLTSCGVKKGYLTPTVQISGARDATCTISPGERLYAIIRKWPNFMGGRLPMYHCATNPHFEQTRSYRLLQN